MATLSDVAKLAGVSVSLVSRVLSDAPDTRASQETRERVRDAAVELGYRANFAARALKSSRTHVLGVVLPDLTNSVFTDLLDAVEEEATRRGYMTLFARAERLLRDTDAIPQLMSEGRVDGVIVQVGDSMRAEDLTALVSGTSPVVFVNSIHPHGSGSVLLDDVAGARCATQHLLDLGHRNVGFVGGLAESESATRREVGFLSAMQDAGLRVHPEYITRLGYSPEQGAEAVRVLLARSPQPSAIVVANVNAAYGALLYLRSRSIEVPRELSVVAIHDSRTAANTWPPLTTVSMPLGALGTSAVSAVIDRIESGHVSNIVVTSPIPELIVRESTSRHTPEPPR